MKVADLIDFIALLRLKFIIAYFWATKKKCILKLFENPSYFCGAS